MEWPVYKGVYIRISAIGFVLVMWILMSMWMFRDCAWKRNQFVCVRVRAFLGMCERILCVCLCAFDDRGWPPFCFMQFSTPYDYSMPWFYYYTFHAIEWNRYICECVRLFRLSILLHPSCLLTICNILNLNIFTVHTHMS